MPKILIHSATAGEIEPLLAFLKPFVSSSNTLYRLPNLELRLCVSGAGMVSTAFALGKLAAEPFDLALQAGIGGSFGHHHMGEVLCVEEDCFSELGAEDGEAFLSMDQLGLGQQRQSLLRPYRHPLLDQLRRAKGITVNRVHGQKASIEKVVKQYDPGVESMEGAAFIYAANACGWPAMQVRAVSNRVETRQRESWNIPLAVKNLNRVLLELIRALDEN